MFISIIDVDVWSGVDLQQIPPSPNPGNAQALGTVWEWSVHELGVGPLRAKQSKRVFKCPPCCPWRTEPPIGSGASEKNSPRESDRDPGLPPAPLATP